MTTVRPTVNMSNLFVNEVLCYMNGKLGRYDAKLLNSIASNFYTLNDIMHARDILLDRIEKLELEKWPRPSRRASKDNHDQNKAKNEADDIISMLTYVDEHELSERLPTFVALNTDMIPSNNMAEGDMHCIMNKLNQLENQVAVVQDTILTREDSTKSAILTNIESARNSICSNMQKSLPDRRPSAVMHVRQGASGTAALRSGESAARSQAMLTDENDDGSQLNAPWQALPAVESAMENDFTQIVGKKRRRQMTEELRAIRQSSETARIGNRNTHAQITKKSVKIVGSASNISSLKAAKPIIKKAIYCVQNIDGATTTEDMTVCDVSRCACRVML